MTYSYTNRYPTTNWTLLQPSIWGINPTIDKSQQHRKTTPLQLIQTQDNKNKLFQNTDTNNNIDTNTRQDYRHKTETKQSNNKEETKGKNTRIDTRETAQASKDPQGKTNIDTLPEPSIYIYIYCFS